MEDRMLPSLVIPRFFYPVLVWTTCSLPKAYTLPLGLAGAVSGPGSP